MPKFQQYNMDDLSNNPIIKAYQVGKAGIYLRKAYAILDELEDMNAKIDGDFRGIMEYCSWLGMCYRQKADHRIRRKQINSGIYEDRFKDNNQG